MGEVINLRGDRINIVDSTPECILTPASLVRAEKLLQTATEKALYRLLSGQSRLRNGRYTPDHIHPECTLHGLDPVTFVVPNEQWVCLVKGCNRVMRLVDGRIEVRQLRNPAPISTESFALECSGGLG